MADLEPYDTFSGSPAVAENGTIYLTTTVGYLYALDPDGTVNWQLLAGAKAGTPVIRHDGVILVNTKDLLAVDKDGNLLWRFQKPYFMQVARGNILGVAADGTAYYHQEGTVYAVAPDGTERWKYVVDNNGCRAGAISRDGTLYLASEYHVEALDPTGHRVWRFEGGFGESYSPTGITISQDGTLLVSMGASGPTATTDTVFAVNADGTLRWRHDPGEAAPLELVQRGDGTVLFAKSKIGYENDAVEGVTALDSTGQKLWHAALVGAISLVLASDGSLYVAANSSVYGLDPSGTVFWNQTYQRFPQSLTITPDQRLLVAQDNTLRAIKIFAGLDETAPWPKFAGNRANTRLAPH